MDAIIREFCQQDSSFEHWSGDGSIQPDVPSLLSLSTLPRDRVLDGFTNSLNLPAVQLVDGADSNDSAARLNNRRSDASHLSRVSSFSMAVEPAARAVGHYASSKAATDIGLLSVDRQPEAQTELQILQEKFDMMERAAKAEIGELRASLLEAHKKLAEVGTERAVAGCTDKVKAHRAWEEEMQLSQQNLLAARADMTWRFETQLRQALRFGPPSELVRRLLNDRMEWLQLHCISIWRAVTRLKPEPQDLRELEVEVRCWEKARRLRRLGFSARKIFSAWRIYSTGQEKRRLLKLADMAHDSWCRTAGQVSRHIDKQFHIMFSAVASRCFIEWLWCYYTSRRLSRFWRWLGKRSQHLRLCFTAFLRAVSACRRDRIQILEGMRQSAFGVAADARLPALSSGSQPSSANWNERIRMLEKMPMAPSEAVLAS